MMIKKLYPEQEPEVRFPFFGKGKIFYFCNRDGLFELEICSYRGEEICFLGCEFTVVAKLLCVILEKIAEGKMRKFFEENTLLNQCVVGEKETIAEFIHKADKEATVVAYKRFALGE